MWESSFVAVRTAAWEVVGTAQRRPRNDLGAFQGVPGVFMEYHVVTRFSHGVSWGFLGTRASQGCLRGFQRELQRASGVFRGSYGGSREPLRCSTGS